jgi:hypothetical protein
MTIRPLLSFAVLGLLFACACPEKKKTETPPTPAPAATPDAAPVQDPPPAAELPSKPGDKCTAEGGCAVGLTCVKYYGIAGPRGPEFATCEVPCPTVATQCPDGTKCVTIADGPGAVCR